jgi:hypothetical protein
MTVDGYLAIGCDGAMPQGGAWNALPLPPELRQLRPDACGIVPATGNIAFGEAKTWGDIDTGHTRRQLRVFSRLMTRSDMALCRLYLAVPRSTVVVLDRVLADIGLLGMRHVVRLHVPDCFVTESGYGGS